MKVVVNKCFGGFSLSHAAVMAYARLKGFKLYTYVSDRDSDGHLAMNKYHLWNPKTEKDPFMVHYSKNPPNAEGTLENEGYFSERDIPRDDKALIAVVQKMGKRACTRFSDLRVVTIPKGIEWKISEYGGLEHVEEKHRTW
jgi:hypothetical protein